MKIQAKENCPNKHCEGGVITYDGQSGRICKKCNPDKKKKKNNDKSRDKK